VSSGEEELSGTGAGDISRVVGGAKEGDVATAGATSEGERVVGAAESGSIGGRS
jgi:hypothetical protein